MKTYAVLPPNATPEQRAAADAIAEAVQAMPDEAFDALFGRDERCHHCGRFYPAPVGHHHTQKECDDV